MKPFRTTVVLLALLVLPLFASEGLADFSAVQLTEDFINPSTKVSANSDTLVMAFAIPASVSGETLITVGVRSAIERSFATERVRLWAEDGTTPGWQRTEDLLLGFRITSSLPTGFETNDVITFTGLSHELTSGDTFYISLDMYNSYVDAQADSFHETGLEVIIDAGFIELKDGQVNDAEIHNDGWLAGPPVQYSPFILIFDTKGPQFDLHFCLEENTCSLYTYYGGGTPRLLNVDHLDSVRICATNIDPDIMGDITVIGWVHLTGYVSSMRMFGVSPIKLTDSDAETPNCGCDDDYNMTFRIPDVNTGSYPGVDADSGHWMICAFAKDTAGNVDTICLGHDSLQYRIDTQDPIIDSVTWEHAYDWNGDGFMGLGDSIMIIGWGLSNAWEPQFECAKMEVDWSWYSGVPNDWRELDDIQEHNRIFRKTFGLTDPVPIDSTDCPVNFLLRAWDNACNEDTLRAEICGTMDLDPPSVGVVYEWHTDYDTSFACIGLGDKVFIEATVGGTDIVSVVCWMDSAGIDENMQHQMPLPARGGGVYDTIWTVTEPPIKYGKDADNSDNATNYPPGPPTDAVYRAWVVACDDVGNCDTSWGELNKTLDSRRPRPIGFACPDTVPCALHARSLAGGIIELYWHVNCDENDAFYFYVWANDGAGGMTFDSIGATNVTEQAPGSYYYWHSEPLPDGYYLFKIKTEDNCSNVGDFSCVVGAYADATPPHVCIAVPDSGLTFGSWFPIKAVADSESHDVDSAMLWYRLRPDMDNPLLDPGAWERCLSNPTMYRPGGGLVFTDSVHCLEGVDYIGWVELLVVACDEAGNCTDTTPEFYDEACVVDDDVFRLGHFWFYWDTLAPGVRAVSVNGFPSPQSDCGFDVDPTIMNEIVIDVEGATAADSFEVLVALSNNDNDPFNRIFHQDYMTMPCTIWVSVDNWDEGSHNLYFFVKNYDNDLTGNMQLEICVPPQPPEDCIYISWPHEWMRIPCTGTSGHNCVEITARMYDYYQCGEVLFTEARFQWSPDGINWFTIEDVIGSGPWSTCWDNSGQVADGDTVYLRVIAHDEYYMADTSYMVKVFVDCELPNLALLIEEIYWTCNNDTIPKITCDPLTLKAILKDTLNDLYDVRFHFKRHSDPDLRDNWERISISEPAWYDNIWTYRWEEPCCGEVERAPFGGGNPPPDRCMYPNDYWDIRVSAIDQAGHIMFDYDMDGLFDDSTFNDAMAAGAGITVYLDTEAPQPAISMVADPETPIYNINPSLYLNGNGDAFVKPGHDITAEISVLPSEDTCEVMKVEWFLCFGEIDAQFSSGFGGGIQQEDSCVHVGTSTDPIHFGVTFNPLADGLIPAFELEDGWWWGRLKAVLYDSLGNSAYDYVYLYILDVTATQAMITEPENDSYVWGSVTLKSRALNAYEIARVCYEMRPEYDSVWYPVNNGYPNACVYRWCDGDGDGPGDSPGAGTPPAGRDCGNPREVRLPDDFDSQGKYKDYGMSTCGKGDDYWQTCLGRYDSGPDFIYKLIVTEPLDLSEIWLSPKHSPYSGMALSTSCPPGGECMMYSTNRHDFSHGFREVHLEAGIYYVMIDTWPHGSDQCMNDFDFTIKGAPSEDFPLDWHTMNTVPDGNYYLRAVAMDCSNNIDDDPYTIRVTVANELPEVTIMDPSICFRECPDNPVDTIGFVGDEVLVEATVDSDIPIVRVEFYYKSIFGYPTSYTYIGKDDWATDGVYDVLWDTEENPDMDGRYHLMARAYNAAGRYADSEPVVVFVDNTKPLVDIVSINGQTHPQDLDVALYDTLVIQAAAWDTLSSAGGTRCYNSGVKLLAFAVGDEAWDQGEMPLSQWNWYTDFHDGDTLIYWNVSGLDTGTYWIIVIAEDCIGNQRFDLCRIHVHDHTPPMVTIGGFYYNECHKTDYIYGYTCDEDLLWAKFEYRKIVDGDTSAWLGVAEPDYYDEIPGQRTKHCDTTRWQCDRGPCCCAREVIQWVWDASASLEEGLGISYQARILSTDENGNNSEDSANVFAPIVNFIYEEGMIVPEQGPLGSMSFEKNFQIDNMAGIVKQTSQDGDEPQMFGLYVPKDSCGNSLLECIWMQQNLNEPSFFAGSFKAEQIQEGGVGTFFSSVTVIEDEEIPQTGEGQAYTYLRSGEIMTVKVDKDLGTFTEYCTNFEPKWKEVCVEIPGGALSGRCDKHIIVWPQTMPPISIFQPTWIPIGDDEGYATYVGFTEDCDYECGGGYSDNSDGSSEGAGGSASDGDYCCFHNGRYATIKMNYSSEIGIPAESLIVAWWDNDEWEWSTDDVFWGSPYSEGFNTEEHYVEFATGCLHGPFAVIRVQDRECEGTIVVDLYEIEPFCNGYTGPMPRFRTLINDNIQGTDHIYEQSMTFKIKKPGQPYITIYNRGAGSDSCNWWAKGFGQYDCGGWDPVTGILGVGWNDPSFYQTFWYSYESHACQGCEFSHYYNNYNYFTCFPAPALAEGDSFFAQVYAENYSQNSCTRTVQFSVDATEPEMWFADSVGAYVGKNPHFCIYFTDEKAGVDKSSIHIDIWGDETSSPDPNQHSYIGTLQPAQLNWVDDTTVCVDGTFEFYGGYLHIYVYGATCDTCVYPQYYHYLCGISDCVGNQTDVFWQYYTIDADGPSITFRGADWCDLPLKFEITDAMSGLQYVEVFEDSSEVESIERDPHNSRYWYYTPSDGPHHVDLRAVDNLGNETVYSFDLTADCVPPVLTFIPGYIDCEDFTISFVLTDAGSGVDWDAVNLDLYYNSYYILSFTPEDIATMKSGDTVTVTVTGDDAAYLQLSNNAMLYAVVYSAKNYDANYTAGPMDLAGNYYSSASYFRGQYYADCSGPSISWKNTGVPKECDWPVLLSVTDAKSGVDEVKVYQDGVEQPAEAVIYNAATEMWEYTPTTGMHTLDVVATDMVGNQTTLTIEVRDDCVGPVVSFADGYVTKNPTLQFVVSDQGSGVDWTTVNAWVVGCSEECVFQAPWIIENRNGDTVTLSGCHLDCSDGQEVEVYVYSGSYMTSKGPADLAGNYAPSYYKCSFVVDAYGPVFSPSCGNLDESLRPIAVNITDNRSGVDWSTLEIFVDSVLFCGDEEIGCFDTLIIDTTTGRIEYMPPAGREFVQIYIRDFAGNLSTCSFYTEEEYLSLGKPHNYPNPFDPREKPTHIVLGLNKTCYVTVKIYDFAGEYVRTVEQPNHVASPGNDELLWDGKTDDATEVANGTYLCYIKARDGDGAVETAVIKITVLKKDK